MNAESSQMTGAAVRKKRKGSANAAAGPSTSSEEPKGVPGLRGRRKLGFLASLPSMPLDILFEILSHLKPYDVLRLARTTKDFRSLLLSRSSSPIWKAALGNIPGLPDCPPGMSEPAWTNLVFSPQCNFCLTTSIRKVQWMFRIRICLKCAKEHLAESRYGIYGYEGCNMENLIPTSIGKKGAKIYLKSDRQRVEVEYAALKTTDARRVFVEERTKVVKAIAEHTRLCEIWARGQTLDRDQELQQLRDDRLAAVKRKLEDLGWAEDIASISMPDSLANHKLVDRPQVLTERIWTNIKPGILEFMAEMREKRFKREFAALVNRRKHSALAVLRTFKNTRLPETEIMPQGPDFCHFPVISEVLNQAADIEVDESSFSDIVPLLPELITEWRDSIKQKMIQVVKRQDITSRRRSYFDFMWMDEYMDDEFEFEAPPVGPNSHLTDEELSQKLTRASTVFTCICGNDYDDFHDYPSFYSSDDEDDYSTACKILFFPQVMGHSCLARIEKIFSSVADPSCRLDSSRSDRKQWDSSGLSVFTIASRNARDIVQLAGLDPDLATSTEMDQLKIRFMCRACSVTVAHESDDDDYHSDDSDEVICESYDSVFPIFNWRGAINHQTNKHPIRNNGILTMMSEDDFTEEIEEAESEHWAKLDQIWSCTHCRDMPREAKPTTIDNVKQHISSIHHIESPILDVDYFHDFAAADMREYGVSTFYVRDSGNIFSPYSPYSEAIY